MIAIKCSAVDKDLKHEKRTHCLDYISYSGVIFDLLAHSVTQVVTTRVLESCQVLVCTRHSIASPIHQITISKH